MAPQLYAAFNINPLLSPAAKANTTQLLINDPTNLLIQMGIQMPENLAGKMVITKAGDTIYGISDTGFITLPVSTISSTRWSLSITRSILSPTTSAASPPKLRAPWPPSPISAKAVSSVSVQSYTIPAQGTTGLGGFGGPGGGGIIGGSAVAAESLSSSRPPGRLEITSC